MASTRQEQPEQLTAEDRGYSGLRFSDVVDALFANPYQRVWGGEGQPPLPVGEVTFRSVVGGILSFAKPELFSKASERALDSGDEGGLGTRHLGSRHLAGLRLKCHLATGDGRDRWQTCTRGQPGR